MDQTSIYTTHFFLRKTVCWKNISLVPVICFPGLMIEWFFHTQQRHFSAKQMILWLVLNGPGSKVHEAGAVPSHQAQGLLQNIVFAEWMNSEMTVVSTRRYFDFSLEVILKSICFCFRKSTGFLQVSAWRACHVTSWARIFFPLT